MRPNLRKRVTLVDDAVLDDEAERVGVTYIFEKLHITYSDSKE